MNDRIDHVVLIGGGLAAAKAAEGLRADGYTGAVILVTDETHRPYERPPLSKGVLVGDESEDTVHVHPADWYAEHEVEVITGDAVTTIDRTAGRVVTAGGRSLAFDRLLLATGAVPRSLPGAGDLDGVVTLRTLDDSRRLGELLRAAGHVTVVGAGWIGCEVAAAARRLGTEVAMVDPLATPLHRVLGPRIGTLFGDLHRRHGVDLRPGVGVTGLHGTDRVEGVGLGDGTVIDTELVVVGIGVVPRVELAEAAGLAVRDGVVLDATLVTDDPRIFAAGDVANAWHPRYQRHLRVEHWSNALHQGRLAAANMLGAGQAHDALPYFFSDQYDLGMEYRGLAEASDEIVVRGDPERGEFVAFWLHEGRPRAAMNVNLWDVGDDLRRLLEAERRVPPELLRDPEVPLTDLAADEG